MLLGDNFTPDLESIDRLLTFLSGLESRRAMDLPGGLRVERRGDQGRIYRPQVFLTSGKYPQLASEEIGTIQIPGEAELCGGWRIQARYEQLPLTGSQQGGSTGGSTLVCFDPKLGQEKLEIRGRQPGDRIRLLGLGGSQKLSDVMINRKLPRQVRARWPLITVGDEILWVAGVAQAEKTRVPQNAQQALVFELIAPGE
jgi:tRNA(Ile)-lysidine synthase